MARFMTREVEGIFKKLEKECGDDISLSVTVEKWHHHHSGNTYDPQMHISIQAPGKTCTLFYQHQYESVEAMVDEVISKMREWRKE